MRTPTPRIGIKSIVLDPTVLNTENRLTSFLKSEIYEDYIVFLPNSIKSLIFEENWNELIGLLRPWEWNLNKEEKEKWFETNNFKEACKELLGVCASFGEDERLGTVEKETASIVRGILGEGSPKEIDVAKELVVIATTKQAGILSFAQHPRRWLKSLRAVVILEITEKTNSLSAAKAKIKKKLRDGGLKTKIYVWIFQIVNTLVLFPALIPAQLGPELSRLLSFLGQKALMGLVIDGLPT